MRGLLLLICFTALRGAEKVEILRDEFGVAHIFAPTEAGAAFGSGYAQAEDRLEELLKNYRRAEGRTIANGCGGTGRSRRSTTRISTPSCGRSAKHSNKA